MCVLLASKWTASGRLHLSTGVSLRILPPSPCSFVVLFFTPPLRPLFLHPHHEPLGQVKQIGASQKLRLADLVLQVSRYGKPGGPTALDLSETVKGFGVEFEETARPECGAALALLLFGGTGALLPGNYSSMELSAESPLRAVKNFPSDLVMLGRATVIIKGIASKVGIPWNLADRFAEGARMALECGVDGCSVPIYSTIAPTRLGKELPRSAAGWQGGGNRRKFKEVKDAVRMVRQVAREWAVGKAWETLPTSAKQFFIQREAKRLQNLEAAEQEEEAELRRMRGGMNNASVERTEAAPVEVAEALEAAAGD